MKRLLPMLVVMLSSTPVAAQSTPPLDDRWTPWIGCWATPGANAPRTCVTPAAGGVEMRTTIDNRPVLVQSVVADATLHAIAETGCSGSQQAEWSRNGNRLYSRAQLTCADQSPRTVSGLGFVDAATGTWLDVQVIEIAGQENVRVRRFRRVDTNAPVSPAIAPRLGATPFGIDEVKEASGKVSPRVIEAALLETKARFPLSGRRLIELDAAGVDDSVIDTMVALTFPEKFVVKPPRDRDDFALFGDSSLWPSMYGFSSFYGSRYSSLSYSPYFYLPFGYNYLGGVSPVFLSSAGFVPVSNGPLSVSSDGQGRVINGRGYTRIQSRAAAEAAAANQSAASDGSGKLSTRSPEAAGSTGSATPASSASPAGISSGGGSESSGRTAQPR
jgi:hypothetical protein